MRMKALLAIALVLCLVFSGCGQSGSAVAQTLSTAAATEPSATTLPPVDEGREKAISALQTFITENGMKISNVYVYTLDTDLTDVTAYAMSNGDAVILSLSYTLGRMTDDKTQAVDTTMLYLSGYEAQEDGKYYVHQNNAVTFNGTEASFGAGVNLDPVGFVVDTPLEFVNIQASANNSDAEITDAFTASFGDGLNTLLELFGELLAESGLNLSLGDFGFDRYQVDAARQSDIRSGAWAVAAVDPAPVSIEVIRLRNNSAGTPELTMRFTNTGDKEIIALDFYVMCYDAYGEVVKGYGRYSAYNGTYQDSPIRPGKSSPSDWYWPLYGFDNAKSVKVAVSKYKLAGEEAVEIPEKDWVWTE